MGTHTYPDWLALVADPSVADFRRAPFTEDIDGEPWTMATNGHVAVMLRGDLGAARLAGEPKMAKTFARLATGTAPVPLDLAALKAFLAVGTPEAPCGACGGKRSWPCRACNASGAVKCECMCGDEHEAECSDCVKGQASCPRCGRYGDTTRVRLGDIVINATITRYPLAFLSADAATIRTTGEDGPIEIAAADWRFLVMPLRDGRGASEFPQFEYRTAVGVSL